MRKALLAVALVVIPVVACTQSSQNLGFTPSAKDFSPNGGGTGSPAGFTENEPANNPSNDSPGNPSSGPTTGNSPNKNTRGKLSLRLTDSPYSDASAVLITFSEVRVHRSSEEDESEVPPVPPLPGEEEESENSGWETIPFAGGATSWMCDLKQLEGPVVDLGIGNLPVGHYTQIRLVVSAATIHFTTPALTGPCAPSIVPPDPGINVKVPSGVVKLNQPFSIAEGMTTSIVLDFVGDKSIIQTGKKTTTVQGNGNGNGNGNSGNSGNGNGKKNDGDEDDAVEAEDGEEGEDGSGNSGKPSYILKPVIKILSVTAPVLVPGP